jgi:hypothetical protein
MMAAMAGCAPRQSPQNELHSIRSAMPTRDDTPLSQQRLREGDRIDVDALRSFRLGPDYEEAVRRHVTRRMRVYYRDLILSQNDFLDFQQRFQVACLDPGPLRQCYSDVDVIIVTDHFLSLSERQKFRTEFVFLAEAGRYEFRGFRWQRVQ